MLVLCKQANNKHASLSEEKDVDRRKQGTDFPFSL